MTFELWSKFENREEVIYVFEVDEITPKVYLGDYTMIIGGVDVTKVDSFELTNKINEYQKVHPNFSRNNEEEMEEFLGSVGFNNSVAYYSDYYGDYEEVLIYDFNDEVFSSQMYLEPLYGIECWDGNKYVLEVMDRMIATVGVDSEYISQSNMYWYDEGYYKSYKMFRIKEIDEEVEKEEKYLLMETSDFPMDLCEGVIINKSELNKHLKSREDTFRY